MALIPRHFQHSIVAIGVPINNNGTNWIGTGFLYAKLITGSTNYNVFLVTNKHVFSNLRTVILRFDSSTGGTLSFNVPLYGNSSALWTGHVDPEIDVAVLPINANVLNSLGAHYGVFKSDQDVLLLSSAIAQRDLIEGDGIFVMGFPMGLVDVQANIAITRQGAIARIRDCLAGRSKSFLVDSPVYPGNSGGPVILKPEIVSIQGTNAISAAYLLGVVASYIPYMDSAISRQTGRNRIIFEENSGLTNIFPVDCIESILSIILPVNVQLPNGQTATPARTM